MMACQKQFCNLSLAAEEAKRFFPGRWTASFATGVRASDPNISHPEGKQIIYRRY